MPVDILPGNAASLSTVGDDGVVTLAMHIPDNYISPSTGGLFWLIMLPIWALCFKKILKENSPQQIAYLGAGAAFSFLIMMFNVPTPGGTTAHGVGGSLIALLLGPANACAAVSVALLLQALLFGDGGLITLGANCFNMAFVLPFVAYGLYVALRKALHSAVGERIAIFLSGYIAISIAALCTAIELGVQPALFHTSDGQALYFPFGLNITIPAMLIPHLAVAGILAGLIAMVVVEFVRRSAPEIVRTAAAAPAATAGERDGNQATGLRRGVWIALAALAALSPLGLIATGSAWGEWGVDEFMEATGLNYVPDQIANGFSFEALLPDYTVPGLPDVAGYIVSAAIGIAVLVIAFRLLADIARRHKASTQSPTV